MINQTSDIHINTYWPRLVEVEFESGDGEGIGSQIVTYEVRSPRRDDGS